MSLHRSVKVTRVPETFRLRESMMRIAIKPFPRKRRDGTYKTPQTATVYVVFPDNTSLEFEQFFSETVQWIDGSTLSNGEIDELDSSIWKIIRNYGFQISRFIPSELALDAPARSEEERAAIDE